MKKCSFVMMVLILSGAGTGQVEAYDRVVPSGDLQYIGSFIPPAGTRNGTDYKYISNAGLGWDSSRNLLLAGGAWNDTPSKVETLTLPTLISDHQFLRDNLNEARVVTAFQDPTGGRQTGGLTGYVRADILHLPQQTDQDSDKYYWINSYYYDVSDGTEGRMGWVNPDFTGAAGSWRLDGVESGMWSHALLQINSEWADANIDSKYIGMTSARASHSKGPSLYAVAPWEDNGGAPPADQAALAYKELIAYPDGSGHVMESWSYSTGITGMDGAWLSIGGKQAFVVLWTGVWATNNGTKWWSSSIPATSVSYKQRCRNIVSAKFAEDVAVDETEIDVEDGTILPLSGELMLYPERIRYSGIAGNTLLNCVRGAGGTVATSYSVGQSYYLWQKDVLYGILEDGPNSNVDFPILLFYDVDQIAEVASGTREAWDIQPYAYRMLTDVFFRTWSRDRQQVSGSNTCGVAYDNANQRLILCERARNADGSGSPQPIYHVLSLSDSSSVADTVPPEKMTGVSVDGGGIVSWDSASDSVSDVMYIVSKWFDGVCARDHNEYRPVTTSLVTSWQDPYYIAGDRYRVQAVDMAMNANDGMSTEEGQGFGILFQVLPAIFHKQN